MSLTLCRAPTPVVFLVGGPNNQSTDETRRATSILTSPPYHFRVFSPHEWLATLAQGPDPHPLVQFVRHNNTAQHTTPLLAHATATEINTAMQLGQRIVIEGYCPPNEDALDRLCNNVPHVCIVIGDGTGDHTVRDAETAVTEVCSVAVNRFGHAQIQVANAVPERATPTETASVIMCILEVGETTSPVARMPCAHPISLERTHIPNLTQHPYLVSIKYDGTRYLVLVRAGRVWMMGRNLVVWRGRWDDALLDWENTLVDVELVRSANGAMACVVIDALAVRGRNLIHEPVLSRLASVRRFVGGVLGTHFPGGATAQRYYDIADMRCALRLTRARVGYPSDGMVFTPASLPYRHGRDMNMFKWKPAEMNSVDLRYNGGRLYVSDDNERVDEIDFGGLVEDETVPDWLYDGAVVECRGVVLYAPPDEKLNQWRPLKARDDKSEPNAQWVAKRVILSIRENITEPELVRLPRVR